LYKTFGKLSLHCKNTLHYNYKLHNSEDIFLDQFQTALHNWTMSIYKIVTSRRKLKRLLPLFTNCFYVSEYFLNKPGQTSLLCNYYWDKIFLQLRIPQIYTKIKYEKKKCLKVYNMFDSNYFSSLLNVSSVDLPMSCLSTICNIFFLRISKKFSKTNLKH